jgi:ABC-2 type transport system ATP-binding protein
MTLTFAPTLRATSPICARGLTKRYGTTLAACDVDLEVVPGEVVGFLGPNGAGKTTVLRVLTGALRASAGDVSVLGLDPFRDAAAVHQRLGYLPGDLRLPGHLTGQQLLDLCAALRDDADEDRESLVAALDAPLHTPIEALSKGNRQKLGIVQALMSRPSVLLLDEPTSGLDPLAQEVFEGLVRQAAERGAAILLSSHVLREVEQVADRVIMLRAGRVVASSRLDALRAAAPHDVRAVLGSADAARRLSRTAGARDVQVSGTSVSFSVPSQQLPLLLQQLSSEDVRDVSIAPADLETLFRHFYEGT